MKSLKVLSIATLCIYGASQLLGMPVGELGLRLARGLAGIGEFVGPSLVSFYNWLSSLNF